MTGRKKSDDTASPTDASVIEPAGRRSSRLRLRAAWMYYVEEMTQNAIADALGIGRVTVVRLLADARALHEVKISLSRDVADLPRLEVELAKKFGLTEAVVAPISGRDGDPTPVVGAATGQFISDFVRPGMRLGVGWGRTLVHALSFIDEKPMPGMAVVSLVGGISAVRQSNPAEFAWQFSRLFQADCYLIAAPAVVDSAETKRALIERCGIGPVFEMANSLDAALLSVGSTGPNSTSFHFDFFSDDDRQSLIKSGVVGDILYHFYDKDGVVVDHPVNQRAMGVDISAIRNTPVRILASGGVQKIDAILGAIRLVQPTVLITDEVTAALLLERA